MNKSGKFAELEKHSAIKAILNNEERASNGKLAASVKHSGTNKTLETDVKCLTNKSGKFAELKKQ